MKIKKNMPLKEKVARAFCSTNKDTIIARYDKNIERLDKDFNSVRHMLPGGEVDNKYTPKNDRRAHIWKSMFDVNPHHVLSKSLLSELCKKKFETNLIETDDRGPVFYSVFIPSGIDYLLLREDKYKGIDKSNLSVYFATTTFNDFYFMYEKKGDDFTFKIILFKITTTVDGHILIDAESILYDDKDGNAHMFKDSNLPLRIIHYIQHLGKPDLRKGTGGGKLNNPKKARKAASQEEYFFDYEHVTLGFEKGRNFNKDSWLNQGGIRMQPYGPRDNPKYKPVLIKPNIFKRNPELLLKKKGNEK